MAACHWIGGAGGGCGASVNWTRLLILLLAGIGMSQQTPIADNFYTAGVVEFRQAVGRDANANLADNLAGYLSIIQSSDADDDDDSDADVTDIIVFPEATLNGLDTLSFVPAVEEQVTPCLSDPNASYYAPFLVAISCAARTARKYIVINISEQQLCSATPEDTRPCAPSGYNVFNTNVVFDRSGLVVSRYRKVHLYGEPRNTTFVPESISFETDFNVTFGHFVCFDILFYVPAHQMAVEQGITDFIFPSMWFSQLPFLTAVQVQQAWAYSNDVNLLASGASHPEYGSSGTGVYHGRAGTITSMMKTGEGERRLYVARVPKYAKAEPMQRARRSLRQTELPNSPTSTDFQMKQDYVDQYESKLLKLDEDKAMGTVKEEVCHGKLCCHFELEFRQSKDGLHNGSLYSYRLAAYDGWRNEQEVDANYVRNCAIFACNGPDIMDCGQLLDGSRAQLIFSRLVIEVDYPKSREFLLMTNSVRENLLPLEPAQFKFALSELKNGNQVNARYALADDVEVSDLLTFAIYGNYYDNICTFGVGTQQQSLDCGFKPTDDGAAQLHLSFGFWLILALTFPFHSAS
ncbi:vanin-like protein 1 [Drosophila grimshawi]|uniref:GH24839 n=1 Tax=Drosophila grimshawi TaxID=7222 RepID=B4JNL0_DROGR|nr:vanin-like protein 1 [Drosophila grimshawi]EDV92303.1 GH24839 [Drosophila grimshawi]